MMDLILRILFFAFFLHKSYGFTYLNATEFERMPPIYKVDNYDSCLQEPSDLYCKLTFQLVSDGPSELLNMIQEYSKHSTRHFNHTKLKHGICVSQRCQSNIQNNTLVSEAALEGCLNKTFWDDYRLKTRLLKHSCYNLSDSEIKLDTSDTVVGIIVLFIIVINIIGSLYDIYCTSNNRYGYPIILSFSIKRNWNKLTVTSREQGCSNYFKSFNGIKCVTAYSVTLVHMLVMWYLVCGNVYEMESSYNNPFFQLIVNGTILMQTVFVMSGFQLAYKIHIITQDYQLNWNIVPKAILKRILRLLPAYGLVILLTATSFKFLRPGPFREIGEIDITYCKRNWWKSILFFNNYVEGPQCLLVTWSIAADMQLFIFGIILMVLLRKSRFTQGIISSLIFLSSAMIVIHTYVRDLDSILIFRPSETNELLASDPTFNEMYRAAHGNMGSYLMGMSLGYFIYKWQQKKDKNMNYSKLKYLFWLVIPMMAALLYSGSVFYRDVEKYPTYVRAICSALNKTAMGVLATFLFAGFVMKMENVYRKVLEWDIWVIPSKLTYSSYLLHYQILVTFTSMHTDLANMSVLYLITGSIVATIISFLLAIPLYILVEAPFSSILHSYALLQKKRLVKRNVSNGYKKTE